MATLSMKPGLRHSVADWEQRNEKISVIAQHQRNQSHDIRQESRTLRNETADKTMWDEYDSSRRLSDRISDITQWKKSLEVCAQEVDDEMDALTLAKEETESFLAATMLPLEVATECLTLREGRQGNELVSDPVEAELKKELEVINRAQRVLQQLTDQAFKQLCLLQEARHRLTLDLQHKVEAKDVDQYCLSLTVASPKISLKPDPTRVSSKSTTPQQWEQFSHNNVARAKEEIKASQQLRELMKITCAQLQNELDTQRVATEFAIRKRTHQLEQATQEIQWQLKKTQDEIKELEEEIRGLERDMQAKTAPLKLVHTRLENRTYRPGMDLCKDEVHYGLVEEAKQLEHTIMILDQKLSQARGSLQALKQHEARMLADLSRKLEALNLEQRSAQTHQRLSPTLNKSFRTTAVVPLTNSSGIHKLYLP